MEKIVNYIADYTVLNPRANLWLAVSSGNITKVKELLQTNININTKHFGYAPLEMSLVHGLDEISKILLEQPGIEFNGFKTRSMILSVIFRASPEVIEQLLNHPPVQADKYSVTQFAVWASYVGRSDLMELFRQPPYRSKLYSQYESFDGKTITLAASVKGHLPIVKLLVEHDCLSIDGGLINGLQVACRQGHSNWVKYVLAKWARIKETHSDESPHIQRIVLNLLHNAFQDPIPADCFRVCLAFIDTKGAYLRLITKLDPHTFCWNSSEIIQMFLDILDGYVTALWLHSLDKLWRHKMVCKWRQSKDILTKIYALWYKAFEQYRGCCYFWWLYFSSKFSITSPDYSVTHMAWRFAELGVLLNKYSKVKQSGSHVHPVVGLLYDAIRLGQVQHVVAISEYFAIDREMLLLDVPDKKLNLLQYASQNREILTILEKSSGVDYRSTSDGVLYKNWFQLINSLSSYLPQKQSSQAENNNVPDVPTDENTIHSKLKDIWELTEKHYKSKEKQRVINAIRKLFHRIAREIGRMNPLFGCRPVFVGSSREGTRPFLPDEFDILMICEAIRKYLNVTPLPLELTMDEKADVKWKKQYRHRKKFKHLVSSNKGDFNVEHFKKEFDRLLQNALINIFEDGVFAECLVLEPQFAEYSRISNVSVIWRGVEFIDMEVNVDVVPALQIGEYTPIICPAATESNFYVFFKMVGKYFPIAHSDVEIKNISSLPVEARIGYKFAKAIRLRDLIPEDIRRKLSVLNIQDCLTSYMLKTCLLFCTRMLNFVNQAYFASLCPAEWAYLLYTHLEARLEDGELPIWFSLLPNIIYRTDGQYVLKCTDSLAIPPDEERPCCTKRKQLLILTRCFLEALRVYCRCEGCDMDHLDLCAQHARQTEIPGLQEFFGRFIKGKKFGFQKQYT